MMHNSRVAALAAAPALLLATACGTSESVSVTAQQVTAPNSQPMRPIVATGGAPTSSQTSVPAATPVSARDSVVEFLDRYHNEYWPAWIADMDIDNGMLDTFWTEDITVRSKNYFELYGNGEGTLNYSVEQIVVHSELAATARVCQLEDITYFDKLGNLHSPAKTENSLRAMHLSRATVDAPWRIHRFDHVRDSQDGRFLAQCTL